MGFQPWFPNLVFPFLIHLLIISATAQTPSYQCMHDGFNFTSNSLYDANLNSTLSSLSPNIDDRGFYNASAGQSPDTANAAVLCKGDSPLDRCRSCVGEAAAELVRLCPNQKQGFIYYEFCTLRFSNVSIIGAYARSPVFFLRNVQNPTAPYLFFSDLGVLFEGLREGAAGGSSRRKVAFGKRSTYNFETLYGLVQCSPDLSRDDCLSCLNELDRNYSSRFCTSVGCRAISPSCNTRFENYPFYNETRLVELQEFMPPAKGKKSRTIVIVVVSVVTFLAMVVCAVIFFMKRRKKHRWKAFENVDEITSADSLQFDFGEIKMATDNFSDSNKLGEGGFGAVYRGKLLNGQEIAVKRLSINSRQGDLEFKNEVLLVAKLQHRNLVRLLGFSIERNEKLLVYEFVKNRSLDKFLFDPTKRSELGWELRSKILSGVARGILYLHEESRLRIIHRDLKAGNVLLDDDMNPKIADFGMAKLFVADETQGDTSRIVGTYGYMSPEYAMHGQFSVKSDVFSFGVLVLEIISGQRNNSFRRGEDIESLVSSAWKFWRQGIAEELIDPMLRNDTTTNNRNDMLRCIHISLLCVQENPSHRPTMASVLLLISSSSVPLPVFPAPTSFVPLGYGSNDGKILKEIEFSESYCSNDLAQSVESSKNNTTVSELYPR